MDDGPGSGVATSKWVELTRENADHSRWYIERFRSMAAAGDDLDGEARFVDAWAPLFFFALLFGLSMDYQLFLLAAIRERYEATGDTTTAIREGIARTGRPITNAALIMIVVFIAFGVTGPIPPTELGVTLALAVLLDATIVRMMLVPSLMGLLGERNWWLPKWLDRILPNIRFSH